MNLIGAIGEGLKLQAEVSRFVFIITPTKPPQPKFSKLNKIKLLILIQKLFFHLGFKKQNKTPKQKSPHNTSCFNYLSYEVYNKLHSNHTVTA